MLYKYREYNIHVMIISRVCVHTSPIHPNGEKVAKSPPYVEKKYFSGWGANAYFCPPPPAIRGKSRPSTPSLENQYKIPLYRGTFCYFFSSGGRNLFLLRFSPHEGPFSPCHFAIFFYGGVFLLSFSPRGWGGPLLLRFSPYGGLSATFSLCG